MPEIRFEAKAETVSVLDGFCSSTGKCRTEFINQLLEDWAKASGVSTARMRQLFTAVGAKKVWVL